MQTKETICSGCGKMMISQRPDKYYQICSLDCRNEIQNEVEDIIDERHLLECLNSGKWLSEHIKGLNFE